MREQDDRGRLRLADSEAELDARVAMAIEAWRELGPEGSGESPEDAFDDAFVDRVMTAEATRAQPRAVGLPVDVAGVPVRSRTSRWRWAAGAAAAGVVGLLAVGAPWSDGPQQSTPTDSAAVASSPSSRTGAGFEVPELDAEGTPGQPAPDDLGARIEAYIADYGRNYGAAFKFHGVVLVARAGEVLYSHGFGEADPEIHQPNTVDTRFRLGLLSEPFTALAVLQLRDEDLLALDDTIDQFIPDFPRGDQIRIRDLLAHRSGIPNYTDAPYFHVWKAEYHDTHAMLERLGKLQLSFAPGTDTAPSNSNYYLLGAIIEQVCGQSYEQYVAEHVFAPAGMTHSTFGDAWETGKQARGNVWNEEEVLEPPGPIDMSTFGAAGGLVSSPADLLAWDRALRGGSLLSAESLEQMATPNNDGYGFGWLVTRAYGQRLLSFPGAIDGYSGSMLRFIEDDTLVVVLANTEVVPGAQVAQDVAMILHGDAPPRRKEPAEVSIAPDTYRKYEGSYGITAQTRQDYADVVAAERFDLLDTVLVEREQDRLYFNVPGHARTWMHPMGRNRFFFKDHSGNKVSFELGSDKRASRMVVHYQGAKFLLDRKR